MIKEERVLKTYMTSWENFVDIEKKRDFKIISNIESPYRFQSLLSL